MTKDTVSLEIAQRLQKAGWRGKVEWYWVRDCGANDWHLKRWLTQEQFDNDKSEYLGVGISSYSEIEIERAHEYFPAPTATPLAEELKSRPLSIETQSGGYKVWDYNDPNMELLKSNMIKSIPNTWASTLPDALGLMLEYLLINKLI